MGATPVKGLLLNMSTTASPTIPPFLAHAAAWASGDRELPATVVALADAISRESGAANDAATIRRHLLSPASTGGGSLLLPLFSLSWPEGRAFLNHGSYGSALRCASRARELWSRRQEMQPVRFAEREWVPAVALARRRLSRFVGSPPEDLVFVTNATEATNCVVRSLLPRGASGARDAILMLNISYGAAKNVSRTVVGDTNVLYVTVDLPLLSASAATSAFVERVRSRLAEAKEEGWNVRLAIIDHITSMPCVTLPVQSVQRVCRSAGVPLLVDGAHALGNIPLDLRGMDVDMYTSNGKH